MLLIQSTITVDVLPKLYNEFVNFYGVTPEQLVILCEAGFIIPNLYADSDLQNPEELSQYAPHPHLATIFDYERTACRVGGIRRNRIFELYGYPAEKRIPT